jgi:branched-chain amino acid transport system substrate-binding protein
MKFQNFCVTKYTKSKSNPRARSLSGLAGAVLVVCAAAVSAQTQPQLSAKPLAGQTVKIMWIDPLSGPMGAVGNTQLNSFQFFAEKFSASNPAGVKFEIVGMDNKLSPTESLNLLKSAIDQGMRYVIQGNGSSVAIPLLDAINKHNERNPGKEVVFLNSTSVDPDLTNSKCSFWFFRFDADTSMKMEALSTFIQTKADIQKVYLFNQNYSHGQQVSKFAKAALARKRPDITVVGEDLHPLAQVRDFAPYIAKIKASGADTVITANWGSDLTLLFKAAYEGGYSGKFLTYYTSSSGVPTALGSNGAGSVYQINNAHYNIGGQVSVWMNEFKAKYNADFTTTQVVRVYEMLGAAMAKAKSTDPVKVAWALEGLKIKSSYGGDIEFRKSDHQLQQTLYLSVWQKADAAGGKYTYRPENTDMTLAPVAEFEPYVSSTPTSCQMVRPTAGG